MSTLLTIDKLDEQETARIVELRCTANGDPYVRMAERMGLEPNLKLKYIGYDDSEDVYVFSSEEGDFGLPIEVCRRIYVRKCT